MPHRTQPPQEDTVESLHERLRGLLREREALRQAGAGRDVLERNRRAIVDSQWALSRALIARYRPALEVA